jgi:hypothetical protein
VVQAEYKTGDQHPGKTPKTGLNAPAIHPES